MMTSRGARLSEYRSKSVRSGAAIGARLFSSGSRERPARGAEDAQACIRSALRRRRRTLGLTQEAAAQVFGASTLTYNAVPTRGGHIDVTKPTPIVPACHSRV